MNRAKRRMMARALQSSRRLEDRYVRALRGIVGQLHDAMSSELLKKVPAYLRHDANAFGATIDGITLRYVMHLPKALSGVWDRHAQDVSKANATAMRVIGIKPSDLRIDAEMSKRRNENLRLLEKAERKYATDVREVFEDPSTFGLRVEEIAAKLKERADVSAWEAERIARDQTTKLNGAITQIRQTNAGIQKYQWSTSLDDRVRPEHAALEGQTFSWDAPPAVGHPGEDILCRCVAVPLFEEAEDL